MKVKKKLAGQAKKNSMVDRKIIFFHVKDITVETIFPQDGFDKTNCKVHKNTKMSEFQKWSIPNVGN